MRAWQANVLGAVAAAGVLAAGLVFGAPAAQANGPASPVRLGVADRPNGGDGEISMGAGLEVWGQPSQLSLFWSPDETNDIMRTYRSAWDTAGLLTNERRMGNMTVVSALEESTGLMRTVTVMEGQGEDRLVLPGITDVRSLPDPTPRGAPVPIPDNAKAYLAHVADDVISLTYSATFLVPMAPDRIVRFYEVELGKLDYESGDPLRASGQANGGEWTRGRELVAVTATVFDKENPGTSFVVVTHTRAINDEER